MSYGFDDQGWWMRCAYPPYAGDEMRWVGGYATLIQPPPNIPNRPSIRRVDKRSASTDSAGVRTKNQEREIVQESIYHRLMKEGKP